MFRDRFVSYLNFKTFSKYTFMQIPKFTNLGETLEPIPPVSFCVVEKLGFTSSVALIDDELVCEDFSSPQQILIPSSQGLKLLDLYPSFLEDVKEDEDNSQQSSDSDSTRTNASDSSNACLSERRKRLITIRRKLLSRMSSDPSKSYREFDQSESMTKNENEVQFEDPLWWKFLPSLKAIGLACLLMNENRESEISQKSKSQVKQNGIIERARSSLVAHICHVRRRDQLISLAHCIGFAHDNKDIEPFFRNKAFAYYIKLRILIFL